jgi:hypothetical protein
MLGRFNLIVAAVFVALVGLRAVGPAPRVAPAADDFFPREVKWVRSFDQGLAQARKTGKPLWVVFRCER